MRPSSLLLWLIGGWTFIGLGASFFESHFLLWMLTGVLLGVAALVDLVVLLAAANVEAKRSAPSRMAVGELQEVELSLHHRHWHPVKVQLFDGLPETVESEDMPWIGMIPRHKVLRVIYKIKPLQRGPQRFSSAHLLQQSFLGFWMRSARCAEEQEVKVYPNYEPVIRFSLLAMNNRAAQMGILALNRPGVSKEFHQLRDFQEGDILSQIDWKATSRRLSLISREYRQQRDQTILFAVDCGRRMRAMDGTLTQFDHCLNAILLLAYIAMRQGDSVGVLGFGGTNRWLAPLKGGHLMPVLLNHLYDYQTTPEPTDFNEATERLMARQKRRCLVIFLTNLRSEDASHLIVPLQMLKRRHVVLVASLREKEVSERLRAPVGKLDDALTCAATHLYMEDRNRLFRDLRDHGILTLDETAGDLPVALANTYLEIKKEGRL